MIPLSSSIRQPETCFRWSVQLPGEHSHVCVAIDDVIVTNTADRPLELHADFDPLSTADWLSLPGGQIHVLLAYSLITSDNNLFVNTSLTKCRVVVKGVKVQPSFSIRTISVPIGHRLETCRLRLAQHQTKFYGNLISINFSRTSSRLTFSNSIG